MKKIIILLCFSIIILSGCSDRNNSKVPSISIDIPTHNTLNDEVDLGWFNDGYELKVFTFDDKNHKDILNNIKANQNWQLFPLTPILNLIVYGNETRESIIKDKHKNNLIPEIKNGYYYFLDQSNEQYCKITDINNFYPSSYNFTLAIYDSDNATLYYYFLNT